MLLPVNSVTQSYFKTHFLFMFYNSKVNGWLCALFHYNRVLIHFLQHFMLISVRMYQCALLLKKYATKQRNTFLEVFGIIQRENFTQIQRSATQAVTLLRKHMFVYLSGGICPAVCFNVTYRCNLCAFNFNFDNLAWGAIVLCEHFFNAELRPRINAPYV